MEHRLVIIMITADVANAVAASAAVVVSIISFVLAWKSLAVQRHHNRLSVRPLAFISRSDYENSLAVKIHNNGVGPLIITSVRVFDGNDTKRSLIEWMGAIPYRVTWDDFTRDFVDRSLAPGDAIVLLKLTGDASDQDFCEIRNACRLVLRQLTVKVEYRDVYDQPMKPVERKLDWFGHNLPKEPPG